MAGEIAPITAERNPTLLADFFRDASAGAEGEQAAGTTWIPKAKTIEREEVAEITYIEIFSPITTENIVQDLRRVVPVIDGTVIGHYISILGRYDSTMAPQHINIAGGLSPLQTDRKIIVFGTPGIETPLMNTTLKVTNSIGVQATAGTGLTGATSSAGAGDELPISYNYRIRVYGYLYRTDAQLRNIYGDAVYGAEQRVLDLNRNREISVTKTELETSKKNWDLFVGGTKQSTPIIMPFIRYAYNAKGTTPSVEYEFNYEAGDVANSWENLYFDFGRDEALKLEALGVRQATGDTPDQNLKSLGVALGDRQYPRPDLFRVDWPDNPFNFGHGYPNITPSITTDHPVFLPIPKLPLSYLVNNEKGRVIVVDKGTTQTANEMVVAIQGVKVNF